MNIKGKSKIRITAVALLVVILASVGVLSGCGKKSEKVTIAIPNDATNEARALLLLEKNGYIKLKKGAGITATIKDVEDANGIEFKEVEAAQVANTLKDVDFGIINSNYAIEAKLNPVKDSLIKEDSAAEYHVLTPLLHKFFECRFGVLGRGAHDEQHAVAHGLDDGALCALDLAGAVGLIGPDAAVNVLAQALLHSRSIGFVLELHDRDLICVAVGGIRQKIA